MTINNMRLYEEGIWDWGFLNDCFPGTKIRVTDIDGAVERNGKFLFIETKKPGTPIPMGQEIFFKNQVALGNCVMYVWGQRNNPVKIRIVTPVADRTFENATEDTVKRLVKLWFAMANREGKKRS